MNKELLQQALDALSPFGTPNWAGCGVDKVNAAITALRAALAQNVAPASDGVGARISITTNTPEKISQSAQPAGWQLVPVSLTMDMMHEVQEYAHILPARAKRIWEMFLDKAPRFIPIPHPVQPAPPECETEGEKQAYAFGWFKALEQARAIEAAWD